MILARVITAIVIGPTVTVGALSTMDAAMDGARPYAGQAVEQVAPALRWTERPVVYVPTRGCAAARVHTETESEDITAAPVRSGPGAGYPSVDTVRVAEIVAVCQTLPSETAERGGWSGVVYGRSLDQCALDGSGTAERAYDGPCRSGWIEDRHLRPVQLYAGGGN